MYICNVLDWWFNEVIGRQMCYHIYNNCRYCYINSSVAFCLRVKVKHVDENSWSLIIFAVYLLWTKGNIPKCLQDGDARSQLYTFDRSYLKVLVNKGDCSGFILWSNKCLDGGTFSSCRVFNKLRLCYRLWSNKYL